MEFAIPAHLAQAVVDYLTKQPYRDVAGLLGAMQTLRPVRPVAQAPRPDDKPDDQSD